MGGRVWTLTQTDDTLWYHTYNSPNTIRGDGRKRRAGSLLQGSGKRSKGVIEVKEEEEGEPVAVTPDPDRKEEELLNDYFQLKVKLGDLYRDWGAADPHFNSIAKIFTGKLVCVCNTVSVSIMSLPCVRVRACAFHTLQCVCSVSPPGVRMLRQDPTECLFSFICTSNNHISRIQSMVERLCQSLGTPLCQLDQTSYHDFPSLHALAGSTSTTTNTTLADCLTSVYLSLSNPSFFQMFWALTCPLSSD